MSNQPLPDKLQRIYKVKTVDEMWYRILTEGNTRIKHYRSIYGQLPSNPRCVNCHRPFAGIGGALLRVIQKTHKSDKNPRFCAACHAFTTEFPGGAEIELTMLFVDVRGSTTIAENMDPHAFSKLMNRFYEAAIRVLVQEKAFIDKLVGDEVTALFIPGYAGNEHAHRAVKAGAALLLAAGYRQNEDPWIPIGVGIHTGFAWVGSIIGASGAGSDFTALGDNVNIAARLASEAGSGEVLISDATWDAAHVGLKDVERRELALKGKRELVGVRVLEVS